MNNIFSTV